MNNLLEFLDTLRGLWAVVIHFLLQRCLDLFVALLNLIAPFPLFPRGGRGGGWGVSLAQAADEVTGDLDPIEIPIQILVAAGDLVIPLPHLLRGILALEELLPQTPHHVLEQDLGVGRGLGGDGELI